MTNDLDLYLTSADWVDFSGSKQLTSAERVKIRFCTYILVTTKATIKINNVPRQKFLLANAQWYLGIEQNFLDKLPMSFDVYIADTKPNGQLCFGNLIARDTYLHKREQ